MNKKRAIITGATSGIGRAISLKLASLGYDIVITGRRVDRLKELKSILEKEYNCQIIALNFDIRNFDECKKSLATLPAEFLAADLLVNNAGLAAGLEHIYEGDLSDWNAMIDTNIKGVLHITRLISPHMIERCKGHIINLGSIAGIQTYENGGVYCASKHALHALSQSMRIDMLKYGIKVTEIRPGMVETEFSLVRFHGDADRANGVYKGVTPLSGEDIASVVEYVVTLPDHVNINDIEIMPKAQANAFYTHRKQ
ncbi:MAG: SDR family NAD(P)-dependent oxidoreductase [Rikenellaceae bacterium]